MMGFFRFESESESESESEGESMSEGGKPVFLKTHSHTHSD